MNSFLFTALPCEARPLIEHFKLKKDLSIQSFEVYCRGGLCLTVTGLGKTAMAAGVAYTLARFQETDNPVMLNAGIAGHQEHAVGKAFLIDKIGDLDSGKNYYPPILFSPPCPTAEVHTVSTPEFAYRQTGLYDMEASAFYETAIRFTTSELIQSLKVVSDNRSSPTDKIKPNLASRWIGDNLPVIEAILVELACLSASLDRPVLPLLADISRRFHVTASQKMQLEHHLNRWRCLNGGEPNIDWPAIVNAKELIHWLDQQIDLGEFEL